MAPKEENDDCVSRYVNGILACFAELSVLPNLKPSLRVNYAFEKLVSLCTETPDRSVVVKVRASPRSLLPSLATDEAEVLSHPSIIDVIPHLRQLCADGEYELEVLWSGRISGCATPEDGRLSFVNHHRWLGLRANMFVAYRSLLTFPYYDNYVDLIRIELGALSSVKPVSCELSKFAIVGSGPLPMTSLCILDHFNQKGNSNRTSCHNIDVDPMAVSFSRALCKTLGHTKRTMSFECTHAKDADIDLSCYDVVYLAALVGAYSEQKLEIMRSMVKRMRPGALVVIRSAHALRSLLYPVSTLPESAPMLRKVFDAAIGRRSDSRDIAYRIEAIAGGSSIQFSHQFGSDSSC